MYNKKINGRSEDEYLLSISQVKMAAFDPHETSKWAVDLAAFVGANGQPTWCQICVQSKYTDPAISAGNEIVQAIHSTQELLDPDRTFLDKHDAYCDKSFRPPASDEP